MASVCADPAGLYSCVTTSWLIAAGVPEQRIATNVRTECEYAAACARRDALLSSRGYKLV